MNVGIYKMITPSSKVYIGQSWNLKERKRRYKSTGGKNQTKLHHSFLKYGFNSLNFKVIHYLPEDITQEVLNTYETLYWQLYKDCGFEMLNIREPGSKGKFSEITKLKMSAAKKGKKHTAERNKEKSVYQKGRKPSKELVEKRATSNTGKKRSKEFAEQCKERYKGKAPVLALKASLESRERMVVQMTKEREEIKSWKSATAAGEYLKIDPSSISKCCKNKLKTAGNFKWKYYDTRSDYKPVEGVEHTVHQRTF